jgi:hypothetical protein
MRLGKNRKEMEECLLTTRMRVGDGLGDGDVAVREIDTGGRRWTTTAVTLS